MRKHIPIFLILFGFSALNIPTVGILGALAYWGYLEITRAKKKNTSA